MNKSPKKLVITRLVKHDRAKVFSALTDPAKMANWFFGMDTDHAKVTVDLRPGGKYVIEMFDGTREKHVPHGTYLEIVPPAKLVFTWSSEGFVTNTKVTIELFEREEGTELVRTHELPEDTIDPHQQGWNQCLLRLEAYLG
jgi:uncharacterized protein YndB with AHSA1/START domain